MTTKTKTKKDFTWLQVEEAARIMWELTGRPGVYLDFEFNESNHKTLNLKSCSIMYSDPIKQKWMREEFWLLNEDDNRLALVNLLERIRDEQNAVIVGYATAAEARSFQALGLDPHHFDWVDLYTEWRQLTFNFYRCQYGRYFSATGYQGYSTPPSFDKAKNKGKDNNAVGMGLKDAVAQRFGIHIDSKYKDKMRDLCIADRFDYTDEEITDIMSYCTMDIKYLAPLWLDMFNILKKEIRVDDDTLLKIQINRGDFISSVAKMESVGFPLEVDQALNLRRNFDKAENEIITDLVENYYPFYVREKKRNSDVLGRWVDKESNFVKFITDQNLFKQWPRTVNKDTGKFTSTLSRADDTLKDFEHIKEIKAYRNAKKLVKQLAWFKKPDDEKKKGNFFDNVGPDNRLRAFLGSFGTQTSRNAPKAKTFVLAMSSWLRCLIRPDKDHAVIGIDYASQEFAIAGVLAKDKNMIAAYASGDPYRYTGQLAGAIPWTADTKACKTPTLILKDHVEDIFHVTGEELEEVKNSYPKVWDTYQEHLGHEIQRNLMKSTCVMGDTLIQTQHHGRIHITNLKKHMLIWDGVEYVKHDGVICQGVKQVIEVEGVKMTYNHKLLTKKGEWVEAETIKKQEGSICKEDRIRLQRPCYSWRDVWTLVCSKFRD
tara:strand:- start:1883 stop:3853 length:1971 start_codon:yes stop_codon:yes gene_type:complete